MEVVMMETKDLSFFFVLEVARTTYSENENVILQGKLKKKKLNSVACSPQANYTDRVAAAC
jgi:hypothetical protein